MKYLHAFVVSFPPRRAAMAILHAFIGESDITKPISDSGKMLKYRDKYR